MAPRWLRKTGRVIVWPVTAPVDALAKRAGRKAVDGAAAHVTDTLTQEIPQMDSKSIFKSKTFWFNVLSAAAEVSGALTGVVPPGTLTLIVNGINVGLRLLSDRPAHLITPKP
jgi:Mg2+/citrate symporter